MKRVFLLLLTAVFVVLLTVPALFAASAQTLNAQADDALQTLFSKVHGSRGVVEKAKGVLIMPAVYKAGIGVGGSYGQGVLRIGGKTVDYYNIIGASYGMQIGAHKKSIILVFLDAQALANFRASKGWRVGSNADVTLIKVGIDSNTASDTLNKPIVAFVVGEKGLMAGVSLEGAKFSKIHKN